MKDKINNKTVNEVLKLSKKILNLVYFAMIIGIVFLITLLIKEWGILKFFLTVLKVATPFFIGFAIAWIFNPLVNKLVNTGIKRGIAALIVYLCFIILLVIFFWFLIPTVYNQLNDLIKSIPDIINKVENWINGFNTQGLGMENIQSSIFGTIESISNDISTNLPQFILNSVSTIFSGVGTLAISLVIGIYMLIDFDSINAHLINIIPEKYRNEIEVLINDMGQEVRKCVNGTLLVALMVFIFDSLGFVIVGLKAPILFGLLCGITDLIPYIGPYIGGAAAVVVGFSQSPLIGVLTLIIATVVQLLENYVLQPVVMSKTMKLHPVTIIIGLLIFGHFFGIAGMILATPTIALLKVIYRFLDKKYHFFDKD